MIYWKAIVKYKDGKELNYISRNKVLLKNDIENMVNEITYAKMYKINIYKEEASQIVENFLKESSDEKHPFTNQPIIEYYELIATSNTRFTKKAY